MIDRSKLPITFDAQKLKDDLEKIAPGDWVPHFNSGYYEGEWSGVALRSLGGKSTQIYPDPHASGEVADTPILARCHYLPDVLSTFECQIKAARLLKLGPDSLIKEHRDYELGFESGELRLHVPITTSNEVDFFLDGYRIAMKAGECWYLNFNLPHKVMNRGSEPRVHLVLDCVINDWLLGMLAPIAPQHDEASPAIMRGGWKEFHGRVLADVELQRRLRTTDDRQSFIKLLVNTAKELGYHFNAAEPETALREARRAWIEKWIR